MRIRERGKYIVTDGSSSSSSSGSGSGRSSGSVHFNLKGVQITI